MVRNQRGFTYPLTLCMLILFSTVLVIYTEEFIAEKRMLAETENILKQDYYLVSSLKVLEETLAVEGKSNSTGYIELYDGQVHYVIGELTGSIWEITLNLKTSNNHEFNGSAFYDCNDKKIIKWVEKN
ncbi:competence type IV pilus minor pilin ComGG [Niallia oryzisoli]|uniref:competence type IV pilus minor pilin ComGG n=1 Tax=Niallia oryzisoli TaxID=1737571 RepID=UPI003736F11A